MGEVIRKERCPKCAEVGGDTKENGLAVYADESSHCFKCGYTTQSNQSKSSYVSTTEKSSQVVAKKTTTDLIKGEYIALEERKITKATCERFGVKVGHHTGSLGGQFVKDEPVVVYPIYKDGVVVKQKVRSTLNKSLQTQLGDSSCMNLFGQDKISPSKKISINITEGEYDAMVLQQETGYASVSGVRGSGGLRKELAANIDWLMKFKHVVLCLDMDETGEKAIKDCISLFEPGMVRVARLPLKDANDMLMAGRGKELKKCLWDAEIIKPPTLVTVNEVRDRVLERPEIGQPFPWQSMTDITYGLRWGQLYLLAAVKGGGKTSFLAEIVFQQLENNVNVAVMSLEETPEETMRAYIGLALNTRLNIPGSKGWDDDVINKKMDEWEGKITLVDKTAGRLDLDNVLINIRTSVVCNDTKFVVLDNLMALSANPIVDGKRVTITEFAREAATQLANLCTELKITIFIVQHLNQSKPQLRVDITGNEDEQDMEKMTEGLTYRTGRLPTLEDIFGGGGVSNLCHGVIALGRNCESKDLLKKNTSVIKFLTNRIDGSKDGAKFNLYYDKDSGRLTEEMPESLKQYKEEQQYVQIPSLKELNKDII